MIPILLFFRKNNWSESSWFLTAHFVHIVIILQPPLKNNVARFSFIARNNNIGSIDLILHIAKCKNQKSYIQIFQEIN